MDISDIAYPKHDRIRHSEVLAEESKNMKNLKIEVSHITRKGLDVSHRDVSLTLNMTKLVILNVSEESHNRDVSDITYPQHDVNVSHSLHT